VDQARSRIGPTHRSVALSVTPRFAQSATAQSMRITRLANRLLSRPIRFTARGAMLSRLADSTSSLSNDPSSATAAARRADCNRDAPLSTMSSPFDNLPLCHRLPIVRTGGICNQSFHNLVSGEGALGAVMMLGIGFLILQSKTNPL